MSTYVPVITVDIRKNSKSSTLTPLAAAAAGKELTSSISNPELKDIGNL